MKLAKDYSPLLWRGVVFLLYCVLISGIIGSKIIASKILFLDGFGVYGALGKVALFGTIAFALLLYKKATTVQLQQWQPRQLAWLTLSISSYITAWIVTDKLLTGERTTLTLCAAHGGLLLSVIGAALGILGFANLGRLFRTYHRELGIATGLAMVFYGFLLGVYALWEPLAAAVLHAVAGLLHVVGLDAIIIPPRTLLFDKFGITVAQYCSGIESIALFSCLYAVVGFLDWSRLRKQRYAIWFVIALVLLFVCNILRIFGLILAGYYINQGIAFSMFHSYAGMVFFILYSIAFWAVAYKHLTYPVTPKTIQENS